MPVIERSCDNCRWFNGKFCIEPISLRNDITTCMYVYSDVDYDSAYVSYTGYSLPKWERREND